MEWRTCEHQRGDGQRREQLAGADRADVVDGKPVRAGIGDLLRRRAGDEQCTHGDGESDESGALGDGCICGVGDGRDGGAGIFADYGSWYGTDVGECGDSADYGANRYPAVGLGQERDGGDGDGDRRLHAGCEFDQLSVVGDRDGERRRIVHGRLPIQRCDRLADGRGGAQAGKRTGSADGEQCVS